MAAADSLEDRRKVLQDELAAQRALVAQRLNPQPVADDLSHSEPVAAAIDALYPRSMTMRLAKQHPALAVGLVALGAALLLRGRRQQLDDLLATAKAVEPWFRSARAAE